eukprot:scaffold798_cov162-Amphora_coffeaeformis.AAC.1
MSYATSATIRVYAGHTTRTFQANCQANEEPKRVRQGSNLHRLLLQEHEQSIRKINGNSNPRTDYDQDETNDDFQTVLDQDCKPFWLPVNGKTDRSFSPRNPNNYPVLRQLVADSVRNESPSTRNRITAQDERNSQNVTAPSSLNIFPMPTKRRSPTSSLTKVELYQEFSEMINLGAPNVGSATHLYLREKAPSSQDEEDMRPVPRSDAEQVYWKLPLISVRSRIQRNKKLKLSVECVGTHSKAVRSN